VLGAWVLSSSCDFILLSFGSLPIKMNDDDINTARVEGSAFAGGRLPIYTCDLGPS
jgi:hypothetical protein